MPIILSDGQAERIRQLLLIDRARIKAMGRSLKCSQDPRTRELYREALANIEELILAVSKGGAE